MVKSKSCKVNLQNQTDALLKSFFDDQISSRETISSLGSDAFGSDSETDIVIFKLMLTNFYISDFGAMRSVQIGDVC